MSWHIVAEFSELVPVVCVFVMEFHGHVQFGCDSRLFSCLSWSSMGWHIVAATRAGLLRCALHCVRGMEFYGFASFG
jgi:hypothetical protein